VAAASPFGLAMISALKGEAADAQGIITIKSLSDYLYRRTSAGLHAESLPARANSKFSFTPKRAAASPDLLNKLSKDNPPEARRAAIGELVSLVRAQTTSEQQALGEALSSQLRAITQDPSESPQVKTRAILALGQLQDQRGKETLVALLTTAPEKTVRQTALEALSQVDDATATAGIRQALQDPDAEIRAAAIRALANRHDEKAQDEIIRLALKDPDIIVRLSALGYLSILPSPAPHVSEQLTSLLKEPNADLRRETVVTLGAMAEIRAVPELLPLLKNDPEPSVRESAAFALGKLSHNDNRSEIEKALSESLKKDKDGSVRAAAAYALGQVGGATAEKRLVEALGSDDAKVRRTAAAALGELKSTRAVKDLIRALSDRDPECGAPPPLLLGKSEIRAPGILC